MEGTPFLHINNDVKRPANLVLVKAEEFATVSFDPIPVGRRSDLLFDDDAQTMGGFSLFQRVKGKVLRVKFFPRFHPLLEILRTGYSLLL